MAGPASGPWTACTAASAETLAGASPASPRALSASRSTSSPAASGAACTPMTSEGGRTMAVRGSAEVTRSVIRIRYSPTSPTVSGSGGSGQVCTDSSRTRSPSSSARLTVPIAPSVGQPSKSSPGRLTASVAVVMTASAPNTAATRAASAFAPAACPPTTATARRADSSTQTTAGSVHLLSSSGAISRTVAPTARKQTSPSHWAQARGSACRAGPS